MPDNTISTAPRLFLPPPAGRDTRQKARHGGALVKTRFRVSSFNNKQGPLPQPWIMTLTGPYGTLLKVEPLIPGIRQGQNASDQVEHVVNAVEAGACAVAALGVEEASRLSSGLQRQVANLGATLDAASAN